jgi:2-polyprenyl-3-methyl-5-hydroxy-6-metoxy-1,4-benzoquinol methylase
MSTDLQQGFASLAERAEFFRLDVARKLDAGRRVEWGQFLTPPAVAHFMASLFQPPREHVRLLDAGAGVGALSAAFVAEVWVAEAATHMIHFNGERFLGPYEA